jgi:hypothetical protein
LTGANVAYSREVVGEVAEWMTAGAWENVVHDRLAARRGGRGLLFVAEARVYHRHSYRFAAFCRDRFEHGRAYARDRMAERGSGRWARLALTPLLPLVLFKRVAGASAGESPGAFLLAAPVTLAFLAAWAVGEGVGYLVPPVPAPVAPKGM